jgi:lysine biosynthesis protein LysW
MTKPALKVITGYCPECNGSIRLGAKLQVGQRIACPHCEIDLEVIGLAPLELDWAFDVTNLAWDDDLWAPVRRSLPGDSHTTNPPLPRRGEGSIHV